jgi:hypothetical protein
MFYKVIMNIDSGELLRCELMGHYAVFNHDINVHLYACTLVNHPYEYIKHYVYNTDTINLYHESKRHIRI